MKQKMMVGQFDVENGNVFVPCAKQPDGICEI